MFWIDRKMPRARPRLLPPRGPDISWWQSMICGNLGDCWWNCKLRHIVVGGKWWGLPIKEDSTNKNNYVDVGHGKLGDCEICWKHQGIHIPILWMCSFQFSGWFFWEGLPTDITCWWLAPMFQVRELPSGTCLHYIKNLKITMLSMGKLTSFRLGRFQCRKL